MKARTLSVRTHPLHPFQDPACPPVFDQSSVSNGFAAEVAIDAFKSDVDRRIYRQLDEGGYLTRRISEPDKNFDYYFGRVFEPEVFYAGKTTVSCSLYTAIKRRNPLCLLNPLFLQMSW